MSKKITLIGLLTLFIVSLFGCSNGGEQVSSERKEYLRDPRYGYMSIRYLDPEEEQEYYKENLEECNKIMTSYLGEDFKEAEVIPISICEMYDSSSFPRGMQMNGVIYLNVYYEQDDIDMVTTLVHEQLHYQRQKGMQIKGVDEKDNVTLTEYIVYNLTAKVCCEYDYEIYNKCNYGPAPKIEELDDSLETLYKVYLGKEKISKELEKKIKTCFESS